MDVYWGLCITYSNQKCIEENLKLFLRKYRDLLSHHKIYVTSIYDLKQKYSISFFQIQSDHSKMTHKKFLSPVPHLSQNKIPCSCIITTLALFVLRHLWLVRNDFHSSDCIWIIFVKSFTCHGSYSMWALPQHHLCCQGRFQSAHEYQWEQYQGWACDH